MDSSCYIKQRTFLHGLRLAKCSVPLVVNKELQMSAVFNVREGMGSARKFELVLQNVGQVSSFCSCIVAAPICILLS